MQIAKKCMSCTVRYLCFFHIEKYQCKWIGPLSMYFPHSVFQTESLYINRAVVSHFYRIWFGSWSGWQYWKLPDLTYYWRSFLNVVLLSSNWAKNQRFFAENSVLNVVLLSSNRAKNQRFFAENSVLASKKRLNKKK